MEEIGGFNMKSVYILLVLVLAASALGCVGKKQAETKAPVSPAETSLPPTKTPVSPAQTPVSPAVTPAPTGNDEFGTEGDITAIDALVNDSSMDIPLSDATI